MILRAPLTAEEKVKLALGQLRRVKVPRTDTYMLTLPGDAHFLYLRKGRVIYIPSNCKVMWINDLFEVETF